MSLFAATGGALWEPQRTTGPRDPERPAAPLVAAPGREDAAALADRAMRTLLARDLAAGSRGTRIQGVTTMDIDCPDCGGRVELNQNNIIPYHDNGSPIVCAGSGRQVSAASTQPRCTWCDAPAACIATSEGDPYMFACDEHCGHGDEEGAHAFLSDPSAMFAIINRLHARVAELEEDDDRARAEEREACAQIVEARVRYSRHRRAAMRAVGDEALRMAKEIRARSKGGWWREGT